MLAIHFGGAQGIHDVSRQNHKTYIIVEGKYMGFKFQKRINLSKGIGLNVSKSGVTPSVRTRYGSISPKGFSIRTGIPGLSYRGKRSNASGLMLVVGVVAVGVLFIGWLVREAYHFVLRRKIDLLRKQVSQGDQE